MLGLVPFWRSLMLGFRLTLRLPVLYYPLMLFLLLLFAFLPSAESGASPLASVMLEPRWLLLLLILGLLYLAFMAGWFAMMAQTVRTTQEANASVKSPPKAISKDAEPSLASLFKHSLGLQLAGAFIPGVGKFFGSFLLGTILQLVCVLVVIIAADQSIALLGGFPQKIIHAISHLKPTATTLDIQNTLSATLSAMSPLEHTHLKQSLMVFLTSFGLITVGYVAFTLWMPLVVASGLPVWRAFWQSLRLFLKYPLGVLLLSGLPFVGVLGAQALSWSENPLLGILAQLTLLLWNVLSALTPFMFLSLLTPPIVAAPLEEALPSTVSTQ